jgi:allantoin racemase
MDTKAGQAPGAPPVVLLINPNTNARTTGVMTELAAESLSPHGISVIGLTAAAGPAMIIDPESLAESAAHVRAAAESFLCGPRGKEVAGIIVAAIGDPGRDLLSDELDIPVVGIGQAAILAACGKNRRFGMATSTPLLAESLAKLVARHGKSEWFTGVRLTPSGPLVLAADPERQHQELARAVEESTADGAAAVIIAGGPLSETAARLARTSPAQIVQPIPSACALLLQLLNHSSEAAAENLLRR